MRHGARLPADLPNVPHAALARSAGARGAGRAGRWVAPALACVGALSLAACGGGALTRDPAAPTDLAGEWVLDRAASDDAARVVRAALPKPRPARDDERSREGGGAGGPDAPAGRGALAFLREFVVPPEHLAIRPGPGATLTIVQGERSRTHELGTDSPPSVTDRFGSRVVRAGWYGRALVVASDGGQQFRLAETFRAGPTPDTLAYRVELRARGLKKIDIGALYRRAQGRPAPRAPVEGPPAPGR
jgi:hypothetical protein